MSNIVTMARTGGVTRDDILRHARTAVGQFGPGKTTVADIAGLMGLSPASVYRFFPSKTALIEAVAEQVLGELVLRIDENVSAEPPGWPKIAEAARTIAMFNWDLVKNRVAETMFEAGPLLRNERPAAVNRFLMHLRTIFCRFLEEGVEAGRLRALDPDRTAVALIDGLSFAYDLVTIPRITRDEYGRRIDALLDLFLRGVTKKELPHK